MHEFVPLMRVARAVPFAGAGLTRVFRSPRANRAIDVVFAVLLVGAVVLTPVM